MTVNPELLKQVPMFSDLQETELAGIMGCFSLASVAAGDTLYVEGDEATTACFLLEGQLQALKALPGGGTAQIGLIGTGSMIGEMALLAGGTRSATVKAITHCRILTVSFSFFHAALDQVSIPAYKILRRVIYSITTRLEELRGRILQQWDCEGYRPSSATDSGSASPAEVPSQTCSFEYRAFLPIIPFFAGFTDDEIDRFVAHARALELPRGEYLYREGAQADCCYLVIRGAVEISVMRDRRYQLAVLGPGRLCGANSLITATERNSDARVRSATLLLRLDESAFRTLYQGESVECLHFQRMVSINQLQELKAADNLLSTLVSQDHVLGEAGNGSP